MSIEEFKYICVMFLLCYRNTLFVFVLPNQDLNRCIFDPKTTQL